MNIRAIGITPNYTNTINHRKAISFGDDRTDEKNEKICKNISSNAIGIILTTTIISMLIALGGNKQNKESENLFDKLEKNVKSSELQKDTFMVKDVTGDEKPDMILFKKDGTKVVLDIAENKILEETANKPILKEVK